MDNQIKIFHALAAPILLAGVPRMFAIMNGTVCAASVLGAQCLYFLPICLLVHIVGVMLTKKDPDFFAVIIRHLRAKTYYYV